MPAIWKQSAKRVRPAIRLQLNLRILYLGENPWAESTTTLSRYNAMTNISPLVQSYSAGPQLLREAVLPATLADLDARPIEGKWSIREVVCHLADTELVYADRMKRVLAEQKPTFFEASPDLFVPALHCPERPLDTELNVIEAIRRHMLPILQASDASDFQRKGFHSLDGPMTLETLLERIVRHIPHHIAFIEEKLECLNSQ